MAKSKQTTGLDRTKGSKESGKKQTTMKKQKTTPGSKRAGTRSAPAKKKAQKPVKSADISELNKNLKLKIPDALSKKLKQAGVENLKDILQKGGLSKIKEQEQENRQVLERLESHANLSLISPNAEINNNLIEQGFDSVTAIGTASKAEFIEKTKEKITEEEAKSLHIAAKAEVGVLNSILAGARVAMAGNTREAGGWRDILGDQFPGQDVRPITTRVKVLFAGNVSAAGSPISIPVPQGELLLLQDKKLLGKVKIGSGKYKIEALISVPATHKPGDKPPKPEEFERLLNELQIHFEIKVNNVSHIHTLKVIAVKSSTTRPVLYEVELDFLLQQQAPGPGPQPPTDPQPDPTVVDAPITSPLAYLADLLEYALKNLQYKQGQQFKPITLTKLQETFNQQFGDLPVYGDEVYKPVSQSRICIEILLRELKKQKVELKPLWKKYLNTLYRQLLSANGISYNDIRNVGKLNDAEKEKLAEKIGVPVNFLPKLFLEFDENTDPTKELDKLEKTFGLLNPYKSINPGHMPEEPSLLNQRLEYLRDNWIKADKNVLLTSEGRPFIDPDLINETYFKSDESLNKAFQLYEKRKELIEDYLKRLNQKKEELSNAGKLTNGKDFLEYIYTNDPNDQIPLTFDEVKKFRETWQKGESVSEFLDKWPLTTPQFLRLFELCQPDSLLDSEWEELFSIILQSEKVKKLFVSWKDEEIKEKIYLNPEVFKLPDVPRFAADLAMAWRFDSSVHRSWINTLKSRIGQEEAIRTAAATAVDEVEKSVFLTLRDNLINELNITREAYEKRYLVNASEGAGKKTNRVQQAIETLQGIIWRTRMGDNKFGSLVLQLTSENFDEEWKWIGTYEMWRAAMFVFLYPENYLLPTLQNDSSTTNAFKNIMINLRSFGKSSISRLKKEASCYSSYFKDIINLDLQAICFAPLKGKDQNRYDFCYYCFGVAGGKVYWTCYKDNYYSKSHNTDYIIEHSGGDDSISFWECIDIRETKTEKVIACYFHNKNLHLFTSNIDKKVSHDRFSLETNKWIAVNDEIDVPDDSKQLIFGQTFYIGNGCVVLSIGKFGVIKKNNYQFNEGCWHDDWVILNLDDNYSQAYDVIEMFQQHQGGLFDRFIYLFLQKRNTQEFKYIFLDNYSPQIDTKTFNGWYKGSYYQADNIIYSLYTDGSNNCKYLQITKNNVDQTENNPGDISLSIHEDEAAHAIDVYKIIRMYGYKYGVIPNKKRIVFKGDRAYYIGEFRLIDKLQNKIVNSKSITIKIDYKRYYLGKEALKNIDKHSYDCKEYFTNNMNTFQVLVQHIKEAYYSVPLLLAETNNSNGYFIDALEYFRSIYNYTAEPRKKIVYYGLRIEGTNHTTAFLGINDLLLDSLDPHAIAATRDSAYLRYTIYSIVNCMLTYADAEFTRDTAESLPRAKKLYEKALELLALEDIKQDTGNRAQILSNTNRQISLSSLIDNTKSKVAQVHASLLADTHFTELVSAVGNRTRDLILPGKDVVSTGTGSISSPLERPAFWPVSSTALYSFYIPPNPYPAMLRMHAEVNLWKLLNGRNVAGMEREEIPFFLPSEDSYAGKPMLIGGQIRLTSTAKPPATPFRYEYLIERAKQFADRAAQMEAAFLRAMEMLAAAEYNLMKARQDMQLAKAGVRLQDLRVREAEGGVNLAELQRERSTILETHYAELITKGNSEYEEKAIDSLWFAFGFQTALVGFLTGRSIFLTIATAGLKKLVDDDTAQILSTSAAMSSTMSSIYSMKANYERRKQEWELQKTLAGHDIKIGKQQIVMAKDRLRITEQERIISNIQADFAEDTINYLANKALNAEMYDWMARILGNVYSYFLQQATGIAGIAEEQLAFERGNPTPGIVQADYWEAPSEGYAVAITGDNKPERYGLTGSARLLQDIYRLDQYRFETTKQKLQLTKTISLAAMSPVEFENFRQTGILRFATPMELFDYDFPGHYLRLIKRVRTSVIALVPPVEGIRATLTTSGISRVIISNNYVFQEKEISNYPQTIALTSPTNATGLFELLPQPPEMLFPFEGMGVETSWEFRMPRASNPFNYESIADIFITIEYTALDSYEYRQQIIKELGRDFSADRPFSIKQNFADAWYHLHNPDTGAPDEPLVFTFETRRSDFPPNIDHLTIQHVVLYFARAEDYTSEIKVEEINFSPAGGANTIQCPEADTVEGIISTRRGKWTDLKGKDPAGEWEIVLPNALKDTFRDGKIEDILFVITFEGQRPEWIS